MKAPNNRPFNTMSENSLNAMLDYLSEEAKAAETKEEILAVLSIARELLKPTTLRSVISGLKNIRAEVDPAAISSSGKAGKLDTHTHLKCTVQLDVPQILSGTFFELSQRMQALQHEDPATFANATSALTWLASGAIRTT